MPVGINQPSNQIKFTNVSIVRLKKGKKRFELACYKNKLLEYRSGAETDLDNVLQIPTVFLSVSKAQTAPAADLAAAFGPSAPRAAIVQEILRRGELQVGERERRDLLERVEKEVVARVAAQLVDPVERRVYTPGMIAKALDQLKAAPASPPPPPSSSAEDDKTKKKKMVMPAWTGVVAGRPAKTQALDAMRALIAHQPIAVMRARMRLRVTCATAVAKRGAAVVRSSQSVVSEGQDTNNNNSSSTGKGASRAKAKKGKKAQQVDEEDHQQRTVVTTTTQEGQAAAAVAATVKDRILGFFEQVETQQLLDDGEEWEVVGFAEPGAVKGLSDFVGGETKGRGRVEVLDMAVTHDDDDEEEGGG
ncbi:hypothetical protein LOZ61_002402 [Ophidiomyces ophidiicola]|nr:hypothetical protein LOZ61_002402 [Ophidiomyces ophidiicola]KAI1929487.1 hypothetical protein LOZ60_001508 [Ophidiomyces ophidiicola]KAI2035400.1 hypothetical protein LOZ45_000386 [Ophidiomyces ophidiicola]KAI2149387.1 hypothetical protein LOZ27_001081 [Ophidiomyces ophidiicola]KAI2151030.1 hypothetical protein LOZ25_006475 [Ophidiomyces ophidiicola]